MSLKLPRNWDLNLKVDMSKIVRSQSMMAVDPKGSGSWPHPPNLLERPLKAGWLKKQRSIVKNWQQRYFVLKGQHLYYYKDEEDLKPQVLFRKRVQRDRPGGPGSPWARGKERSLRQNWPRMFCHLRPNSHLR
uniref:PH domain-containing protein n=1 Tax=Podarcis muralis TaxID=64176 RepID=A0A670J2W7_PODMU